MNRLRKLFSIRLGTQGKWWATCLLVVACCAWALPAAAQKPSREGFSIRQDELLYQLEEAVGLIAQSLNRLPAEVKTLAINSFYFGKGISSDIRRKGEIIILDKLLAANPNIKLVQCQECRKLETKIVRGVLRLRKGIPSGAARQELAKKLGVDGFIDIGMFSSGGQLTVYLKVTEAKTGAILLVDELAGRRASKRHSLTFFIGDMNFPIKSGGTTVDHNALLLSVQESVQLTDRFSFAADLTFFTDNNDLNTDSTLTLDSGAILTPTLGFDLLQLRPSTSRLIFYLGIGKVLSPQLNYATLYTAGLQFVVGDRLVVQVGANVFPETNVDTGSTATLGTVTLSGTGNEIRFGYRF